MQVQNTRHARGADSQLRTYYASAEVIAQATEYLAADLQLFGYGAMQSAELQ